MMPAAGAMATAARSMRFLLGAVAAPARHRLLRIDDDDDCSLGCEHEGQSGEHHEFAHVRHLPLFCIDGADFPARSFQQDDGFHAPRDRLPTRVQSVRYFSPFTATMLNFAYFSPIFRAA